MRKFTKAGVGTVVRTILQVLAYINQIVALIGQTTFANQSWYQWMSFGLTVTITLVSYWYNNDWTNFATLASDIFVMLKDGKITQDEIEEFIKKHTKQSDTTVTVDEQKTEESKEEIDQ